MTKIEWTDRTWNPVTGCTRVSAGCDHCYAVTMTKRLEAMGNKKYAGLVNVGKGHFNGVVKRHEDTLHLPLSWRKPSMVFVNSMSDLFHKEVPFEFVDKVFAVMALTTKHTYQILTKRPERMAEYFEQFDYDAERIFDSFDGEAQEIISEPHIHDLGFQLHQTAIDEYEARFKHWPLPNVWLGTSIENQEAADERIPHLLRCPAAVRFLSCEPLLGPIIFDRVPDPMFKGISPEARENVRRLWVIVGGESGPDARPMHPDWARSIRDQCTAAGVPFFFKQWGDYRPLINEDDPSDVCYRKLGKKRAGRLLDGREWNEYPKETSEWLSGDATPKRNQKNEKC